MHAKPMFDLGLIQGRFHIIHNGHLEYFEEACKLASSLYIGISDPDPDCSFIPYEMALHHDESSCEPFRSLAPKSLYPFTFFERAEMIAAAFKELGIAKPYRIVPFPIHKPLLVRYYVPLDTTVLLTIYDDWGHHKKEQLEQLGYRTHIVWERSMETRFATGTDVRNRICRGEAWEHLVPPAVAEYMKRNRLDEKLRQAVID